jgi:hypothetical protein
VGAEPEHAPTENRDGQAVPLSNGEFSLLVVLLGAPNRILSRDQLLDMSRLHSDDVYNRSVNTQILRLRRKLEADPAKPTYILTERGAGIPVRRAGRNGLLTLDARPVPLPPTRRAPERTSRAPIRILARAPRGNDREPRDCVWRL